MLLHSFDQLLKAIQTNDVSQLDISFIEPDSPIKHLQPLQTWEGHRSIVSALTVLPDGSVVSGSWDSTLRRWSPDSRRCIGTWEGHTGYVTALAVLPDGSVVSGSTDTTLRRWDPTSGQCMGTWKGHTGKVLALAVLPDGSVVSGSEDNTLRRWGPGFGQCLGTWTGHTNTVSAVVVLPDGTVVSGSRDTTLRRWNPTSGLCLETQNIHITAVSALAVLPDGSVLSGSIDGALWRWDPENMCSRGTWTPDRKSVEALVVLPDGTVMVGSHDKIVRRWDPEARQQLDGWDAQTRYVTALALLPDESIVSTGHDKTVRQWPPRPLSLTLEQIHHVLEALKGNRSVQSLWIVQGVFSPGGFDCLLQVLRAHPALNTLSLENCGLNQEQVRQLLMVLEEGARRDCATRKTLSLEGNVGLDAAENQQCLASGYLKGHWLLASKGFQAQGYVREMIGRGEGQWQWWDGLQYATGVGAAADMEQAQRCFAKARGQALPPITVLISLISSPNSLAQQCGLTLYHLIALMGDVRWYESLRSLSPQVRQQWGLNERCVLAKNPQGLRASVLAQEQVRWLASEKGIKALSTEALSDPVFQAYGVCAKALRQGEEEAQLAQVLRAQQAQAQACLDYNARLAALLANIDRLRHMPEQGSPQMLSVYSSLLLRFWQIKHRLIKIQGQWKGTAHWDLWPSEFNAYVLRAPAEIIQRWSRPGASKPRIELRLKAQWYGEVAYVEDYRYWLDGLYQTYCVNFHSLEDYSEGKNAFNDLLHTYDDYITLWNALENHQSTLANRAYLRHTPTLLLQPGKEVGVVDSRPSKGASLSPAQKLSYFLDKGLKIEGMVGAGTAPVFPIHGVHYKRYPHAPGVEFMVSSLGNVLAGEGATPTVLLKVIGPDGIPYPYQASHTVQGRELQSLIMYHPEHVDKIRPNNFSAVAILGMLTDPQDGKPDNYMVEFQVDPETEAIRQVDILGIDNDLAFADVVVSRHMEGEKAGHYFINIKNVIYFFPQMHEPIDPDFRETFLKREPEFILIEWLKGLLAKNKEYETLLAEGIFTEEEYSGDGIANKRGLQLPIRLVPGTIRTLYRKLRQMNHLLKAQPTMTLWALLAAVEPAVANHYAKVKDRHPHPILGCDMMACVKALYEENIPNGRELMYFRAQLDKGFTHTMTSVVLRTAEEFGFEDKRTAHLDSCVWQLLKVLDYEPFSGALAPVLYNALSALVSACAPGCSLLNRALAHDAHRCVDWLWRTESVEKVQIKAECRVIKKLNLLHFYAAGGCEEGVSRLLEEAAYPVDVLDRRGQTPLHVAASVGDERVAALLIEHGADVQARTTQLKETPLDVARRRGRYFDRMHHYAPVIACLMDHGATSSPEVIKKHHQAAVETGAQLNPSVIPPSPPNNQEDPHSQEAYKSPHGGAPLSAPIKTPPRSTAGANTAVQSPARESDDLLFEPGPTYLLPGTFPHLLEEPLPETPTQAFVLSEGPDLLRAHGARSADSPQILLSRFILEMLSHRLYGFYGVPTPEMTVSVQACSSSATSQEDLIRENRAPPGPILDFACPEVPHLLSRWLDRFTAYGTLPCFTEATGGWDHFHLPVKTKGPLEQGHGDPETAGETFFLPERGLGHILAVAQLLNNWDAIGESGGNVGYYLRTDTDGALVAVSANIDPAAALSMPRIPGGWLRLVDEEPDETALKQQQTSGLVFLIRTLANENSQPSGDDDHYVLHTWHPENRQIIREHLLESAQGRQIQALLKDLPPSAIAWPGALQNFALEVAVARRAAELGGFTAFTVTRHILLSTAGDLTGIAPAFETFPLRTRQEFIHTVRQIISTPTAIWRQAFAATYQAAPLKSVLGEVGPYIDFLTQRQAGLARAYNAELSDEQTYPEQPPLPRPPTALSAKDYQLWQGVLAYGARYLHQPTKATYIPLWGTPAPYSDDEQRQRLDAIRDDFLCHPHQRVWRLLGDPGAGKSTVVAEWAVTLWETFQVEVDEKPSAAPWRTLHIPLSQYDATTAGNCIVDTLQTRYHWTQEAIEAVQEARWLFILDGYDEVLGKPALNLYKANGLGDWPHSKVIITCRSDDPRVEDRGLFAPPAGGALLSQQSSAGLEETPSLLTTYISPLTQAQIEHYLAHQIPPVALPQGWLAEREHLALLSNPFALRLAAKVLPDLLKAAPEAQQSPSCSKPITRSTVYATFLSQWFHGACSQPREEAEKALTPSMEASFYQFFYRLGLKALQAPVVTVDDPHFERFFNHPSHPFSPLACPLHYEGQHRYRFFHRSYGEYAAAQAFMDSLLGEEKEDLVATWSPVNVATYLTLMEFLVEGIHAHPQERILLSRLWDLVNMARTCPLGYLGSNALSLLHRLGEPLTDKNFRTLYAPGVDLRYSCLTGSDWTEAVLTDAQLQNSLLRQTCFTKASLHGAQWGQSPALTTQTPGDALRYTPEGRHLLIGAGHTVMKQDLTTGEVVQRFTGHTGRITCLSVSTDGRQLFTGSRDNTIRQWDMASGASEGFLQGEGPVMSHGVTRDGKIVVSAAGEGTLQIWEIEKKRCVHCLRGHNGAVNAVVLIGEEDLLLVSGGADKTLRLWDRHKGTSIGTLTGHEDTVAALSASPRGDRVASASHDKSLRIWDIEARRCVILLRGHTHWVSSVAYSPDGATLASGSWDKTVRLWDAKTGECLAIYTGHRDTVLGLAFHPEGWQLAGTGADNRVCRWEIAQHPSVSHFASERFHREAITGLAITASEDRIVSASWDGSLRWWSQKTGQAMGALTPALGQINAVAAHPRDPRRLVSGHSDGHWRVWDDHQGRCGMTVAGHETAILSIAYSPDGRRIATAGRDRTLRVWVSNTGRYLRSLSGHTSGITSVKTTPDGQYWVSSSFDKTVRVWDAETGRCTLILEGHTRPVMSIAVHPERPIIASGSADNTIRLWNKKTGDCMATLKGHKDTVTALAYSRDGAYLASASVDTTVRLWPPCGGDCLHVLDYHRGAVNSLLFTHSERLVSAGADHAIAWWSRRQGKEKASWELTACTHPYLSVQGMVIEETQGLTPSVWQLLVQGGAKGNPGPLVVSEPYHGRQTLMCSTSRTSVPFFKEKVQDSVTTPVSCEETEPLGYKQ